MELLTRYGEFNVSAIECNKRETFKPCRAGFVLCRTYLCAEPCITIGTSLLEVATRFDSCPLEMNRNLVEKSLLPGIMVNLTAITD